MSTASAQRVIKRRRKRFACDACHKRKIQCDRAAPRCNWCLHHDLPCTFSPGSEPPQPQDPDELALRRPESTPPGVGMSWTACEQPTYLTSCSPWENTLHLPGGALGITWAFNGLPFFSASGRAWIETLTGEEFTLCLGSPPQRTPCLAQAGTGAAAVDSAPVRHVALPPKEMLYARLAMFRESPFSHITPFIDPVLFEYTIHAAYHTEALSPPRDLSARACVFSFFIISSILTVQTVDATRDNDLYVPEAFRLVLALVREPPTLESVQSLLMMGLYSQAILGDLAMVGLLLSSATRFIFHLGGQHFPDISPDANHTYRHFRIHIRSLFWLCYSFNQEYSMRTGLPPHLDNANCDLTLPDVGPQGASAALFSSPIWIPFLRIAIIQSEIYRELYSVSARGKSDVELFATIRDLDTRLEEWKQAIPDRTRPTFTGRPTDARNVPFSLLQLIYHHCMAIIHQASGRCTSWMQNQDTLGPGSSLAISVEASRSLLRKCCESHLDLHLLNLLFCLPYFTTAMIHVFCNALLHPAAPDTQTDLCLIESVPERLIAEAPHEAPASIRTQVQFVWNLGLEMQRLVHVVIQRSNSPRK